MEVLKKAAEEITPGDKSDYLIKIGAPDGAVQDPFPMSNDSIYAKDLDLTISDNYNFSGSVTDYFDSLLTVNNDSTANNPKQILLWFKRTLYTAAVGFGCNDLTKSFSNIKMSLLGSGQVVRQVVDFSSDNTKYNSRVLEFAPSALNGILLEFYTADEVGLSNITIRKGVVVEAQLKAQREDGTIENIGATDAGNLKVANVEDGLSIAKGDVPGSTFIHKFGDGPNFDPTDGFVTVWDGADKLNANQMQYVYSITNDINRLSSSNAADVMDIEVEGLDINYALVIQTVTLAGQTPVLLSTSLLRIFRMKNVGSTDIAGIVYCYTSGATVTAGVPSPSTTMRAIINNGNNQTLMSIYTVPAGKTAYMRDWYAAASAAKRTATHQVKLLARPFGQVFQLKHKSSIALAGTSYIQHRYEEPEVFTEKTDVAMTVNTDEVDAGVSSGFDLVLIDNV